MVSFFELLLYRKKLAFQKYPDICKSQTSCKVFFPVESYTFANMKRSTVEEVYKLLFYYKNDDSTVSTKDHVRANIPRNIEQFKTNIREVMTEILPKSHVRLPKKD